MFGLKTRQNVRCPSLYTGMIDHVKFIFRESESPLHQFASDISHGEDLPERLMIRSSHELDSLQVKGQNRYGPYDYHTLPLCCGTFSLFIS